MTQRINTIGTRGGLAMVSVILISNFLLAGCKKLELTSQWRDGLVAIDGENREWTGATTYLEDNNAAIGLLNDEEYLYVSLLTMDRMLQNQIMRAGFTLWFDPDGGKDKTFGIRFPLGMNSGEMDFLDRGGFGRPNFDSLQQVFAESQAELEILGPGQDEVHRLPVKEVEDIFVAASVSSKGLIYELRIPLVHGEGRQYAIGAAGGIIGIGLETLKIDMSQMRRKMGGRRDGGMGGGGRPGGGGRGSGMRGGGMGGRGRPEMPKPLKVWAKVTLASDSLTNLENEN